MTTRFMKNPSNGGQCFRFAIENTEKPAELRDFENFLHHFIQIAQHDRSAKFVRFTKRVDQRAQAGRIDVTHALKIKDTARRNLGSQRIECLAQLHQAEMVNLPVKGEN